MSVNSIFAGSTPNSRDAIRQQYLNYLALDIANMTKNLNANKLFKANGATGSAPADTRSATEKYADFDGLKQSVRSGLRQITDGREAEIIVAELTQPEVEFLAGQLPFIIKDLKPKWALGVPAGSFIPYFRKYMRKNIETEGVEFGIQQPQVGGVGGGFLTTAGNFGSGGDRQRLELVMEEMDNLPEFRADGRARNRFDDLQETPNSANEKAKLKFLELTVGARGKDKETGLLGSGHNLKEYVIKMPTDADREAVASLNNPIQLDAYDQIINELGETLPHLDDLTELANQALECRRQGDNNGQFHYLEEMEQRLDGIDWDVLDEVYSINLDVKRLQRGETLSAPKITEALYNTPEAEFDFTTDRDGGTNPLKFGRDNRNSIGKALLLDKFGSTPSEFYPEELAFRRPRPPPVEQESSDLPSAYMGQTQTPQPPTRLPAGLTDTLTLEPNEFAELETEEKLQKLDELLRAGEFAEHPELAPEIIKLSKGIPMSDEELDYLYAHYMILEGKFAPLPDDEDDNSEGFDYDPEYERKYNRDVFPEGGFSDEEGDTAEALADQYGREPPNYQAMIESRGLDSVVKDMTEEAFARLSFGEKKEFIASMVRNGFYDESKYQQPAVNIVMDVRNPTEPEFKKFWRDSLKERKDNELRALPALPDSDDDEPEARTPSAKSSRASSVRGSPAGSEGEELVDTPPSSAQKAEKAVPIPDTFDEFNTKSLQNKRDILRSLPVVPAELQKSINTLKPKAREDTVDTLFKRYLHYKEEEAPQSGLVSSAVKAIEGRTGKGESTIGSTQQGSPPKGSSNISGATEDLFAQSSPAEKARKQIHYPKTTTEFYNLKVPERKAVFERIVGENINGDSVLDHPIFHDEDATFEITEKDKKTGKEVIRVVRYDPRVAEAVETFEKDLRVEDISKMSGSRLQQTWDAIQPFINDLKALNYITGEGMPAPHHIIGTHGYGLPHTLTKQTMMGTGLKKKSKPTMVSNDIIHIDFEKGSLPKSKKKGNIIFGKGLSSVMPQPKLRVESKNIDFSKGITAEPAYVPFGTHLLNKHKLKDNIVMMRTKKGGAIVNIPTQRVNGKLAKVLHTICGGGIPQFESVMDLADDDKALLHRITKTSKVSDRLSVPNPNKTKMEEEDNRFNLLRGEVSIGNDNPAVIKEFKVLLLKFMREGRVPMGQGKAIMEELLLLGY